MNLLRYIKGLRRGKEAHYIELEAMKDPFLSDVLEGYDALDDDHLKRISYLQKKVKNHHIKKKGDMDSEPESKRISFRKKKILWKKWSIVATLLLLLSLGTYYVIENYELLFNCEQPLVPPEHQKKTESVAIENDSDWVKPQQDILATDAIKEPPLPKPSLMASEKTLQEEVKLKENRKEIEVVKPDAPQTQLQSAVTDQAIVNEESSLPEIDESTDVYKNRLKTSATHPTANMCKDVKGTVKLLFFIDNEGNPYNIRVTKSLCDAADKEAVRLIRSGRNWAYKGEAIEIEIAFN